MDKLKLSELEVVEYIAEEMMEQRVEDGGDD